MTTVTHVVKVKRKVGFNSWENSEFIRLDMGGLSKIHLYVPVNHPLASVPDGSDIQLTYNTTSQKPRKNSK